MVQETTDKKIEYKISQKNIDHIFNILSEKVYKNCFITFFMDEYVDILTQKEVDRLKKKKIFVVKVKTPKTKILYRKAIEQKIKQIEKYIVKKCQLHLKREKNKMIIHIILHDIKNGKEIAINANAIEDYKEDSCLFKNNPATIVYLNSSRSYLVEENLEEIRNLIKEEVKKEIQEYHKTWYEEAERSEVRKIKG